MTEPGPWGAPRREADPEPARPAPAAWGRRVLWLALLAGGGALLAVLFRATSWTVRDPSDWVYLLVCGLFLLGMTRRMAGASLRRLPAMALYVAIWAGVIGLLGLGYLYRAELAQAPQRLRMALHIGVPVATGERELRVAQNQDGAFMILGQVNGKPVRFMVDTGASDTVLSPADAQAVGLDVKGLRYDRTAETANGLGYGAAWTADRLDVGAVRLDAFPMTINKTPMSASLLGMTFLNQLESFEVRDRTLILRWRETRRPG